VVSVTCLCIFSYKTKRNHNPRAHTMWGLDVHPDNVPAVCAGIWAKLLWMGVHAVAFMGLWVLRVYFGLVLDLLWYLALGSYTLLCIKEAKDTTDDLASINQADVTVTLVAYGVAAVLALMLRHIMFDLWRSRGDASAVFAPLACFHCIARVLTGYVCMRYIRRQPTWWLVWIVVYILVFFADFHQLLFGQFADSKQSDIQLLVML